MLAQGYARTYRANAVLTASPGQLVLMLYDGALRSLGIAREAFSRPEEDRQRLAIINQQLQKAQLILAELQSGLNLEAGGEVAATLNRLYDYHARRLYEANIRKSEEPVKEVERLLLELREAWAQMLSQGGGASLDQVRTVA